MEFYVHYLSFHPYDLYTLNTYHPTCSWLHKKPWFSYFSISIRTKCVYLLFLTSRCNQSPLGPVIFFPGKCLLPPIQIYHIPNTNLNSMFSSQLPILRLQFDVNKLTKPIVFKMSNRVIYLPERTPLHPLKSSLSDQYLLPIALYHLLNWTCHVNSCSLTPSPFST